MEEAISPQAGEGQPPQITTPPTTKPEPAPAPQYAPTPPPVYPTPPPTQPTSPHPKRGKFIAALILVFFLLVLGGLTVVFAVAYQGTELPFVSKELSLTLQKAYANLPLVPKAPRHILLQSWESSLKVETLILDASMSVEGFDLSLYGSAQIKEGDANFTVHLTGKSSNLTFPLALEMDLVSLEKVLYFKIDTLTSPTLSSFIDLSPALGKWWRFDLSTLETQAREELEKEQGGKGLTQQAQQRVIELFSHPEVLNTVARGTDEQVGEEDCYHLHAVATKEAYVKLAEILKEDSLSDQEKEALGESFETLEKLELDFWIGKNSLMARKMKLLFKTKSLDAGAGGLYSSLLGLQQAFEGVFVLELPEINIPVSINAPEDSHEIDELVELLFESQEQPLLPEVLGAQTRNLLKKK